MTTAASETSCGPSFSGASYGTGVASQVMLACSNCFSFDCWDLHGCCSTARNLCLSFLSHNLFHNSYLQAQPFSVLPHPSHSFPAWPSEHPRYWSSQRMHVGETWKTTLFASSRWLSLDHISRTLFKKWLVLATASRLKMRWIKLGNSMVLSRSLLSRQRSPYLAC